MSYVKGGVSLPIPEVVDELLRRCLPAWSAPDDFNVKKEELSRTLAAAIVQLNLQDVTSIQDADVLDGQAAIDKAKMRTWLCATESKCSKQMRIEREAVLSHVCVERNLLQLEKVKVSLRETLAGLRA